MKNSSNPAEESNLLTRVNELQAKLVDVHHELDKFKANARTAAVILGLIGLASVFQFFRSMQGDLIHSKISELDSGIKRVEELKQTFGIISAKDGETGVLQVGEVQICWGQMEVANTASPSLRQATCRFPEAFGSAPRVTLGIRPDGSPVVWSTDGTFDKQNVTSDGYSGHLVGVAVDPGTIGDKLGRAQIRVDYIAVGKRAASKP